MNLTARSRVLWAASLIVIALPIFSIASTLGRSDETEEVSAETDPLGLADLTRALGGALNEEGKCRYKRGKLTGIERASPNQHEEDWTCLMLKHQLSGDTLKGCTPDPASVFAHQPSAIQLIAGKNRYFKGLIKKRYQYELIPADTGNFTVRVKIHFYGEPTSDAAVMGSLREKLRFASELWTKYSPAGRITFAFEAVDRKEDGFFSVKLQRKDGSIMYDKAWGVNESRRTVAHEVGHMMGLVDEYNIIRSVIWQIHDDTDSRQCYLKDIMCDPLALSSEQQLDEYLYYVILRRALCRAS